MSSVISMRARVLGGYRKLLRRSRLTFNGDQYALVNARLEIRKEFLNNKDEKDERKIEDLLKGVQEAHDFLAFNIVQGTLNERENFEVKLTPEQSQGLRKNEELLHIEDELPPQVEECCNANNPPRK